MIQLATTSTPLRSILRTVFVTICLATSLFKSELAQAKPRYSQIVLNLPEKRAFHYEYYAADNALMLEIAATSPAELKALEHYDESLVRRVLIKDLGGQGTEIRFILRDINVRATVLEFDDPFRISVELFDTDYQRIHSDSAVSLTTPPQYKFGDGDPELGHAPRPEISTPKTAPKSPKPQPSKKLADETTDEAMTLVSDEPQSQEREPAPQSGSNPQPRRLLQPAPELLQNSEQMLKALAETSEGVGKAWTDYPIYIYRLQTAVFESNKAPQKSESENVNIALTSSQAMAEFAAKQFDFGHENRALLAYQQVLHRTPQIFQQEPLHLWRFAEIHLGQGNLTLADGYFDELQRHFSGHPLEPFAKMRRLDIRAIQAVRAENLAAFKTLFDEINRFETSPSSEYVAQAALRRAYWDLKNPTEFTTLARDRYAIPLVSPSVRMALNSALPRVEGQKTGFLASTLVLTDMTKPEAPWSEGASKFAADYVDRYRTPSTEPIYSSVRARLVKFLQLRLQDNQNKKRYIDAIALYEQTTPAVAAEVKAEALTAWSMAESYRQMGQPGKAMPFYAMAFKNAREDLDRFKAMFWLTVSASQALAGSSKDSNAQKDTYRKQMQTADRALLPLWQKVAPDKRAQIYASIKPTIEEMAISGPSLKSPPKVVLETWSQALTVPSAADKGQNAKTEWANRFSPTSSSVTFLTRLAKRFADQGLDKERKEALQLLRSMKPGDFKDDPSAKRLWVEQVVGLADEYRKSNQNLEAGRLFALAGKESEDWEGRAASLYKGGLLLMASGRKTEAVEALKLASEDSNNLYYSNLAKERLNQISSTGGNQ